MKVCPTVGRSDGSSVGRSKFDNAACAEYAKWAECAKFTKYAQRRNIDLLSLVFPFSFVFSVFEFVFAEPPLERLCFTG